METTDTSGAHVFLVLWKAWRAMSAHDERSIRETVQVCPSDFVVLESLLHKGPMTVSAIGRKVMLSSGSTTTAVDRLEKRGLVERRADDRDRRVAVVALTPAGRMVIEPAYKAHAVALERAASGLSPAERQHLITLLKKLGVAAEESFAPSA
jgi:MarR family transcriptional regulator, 2-MHQ and catechol-resistance regulon repressor